jgi:hypothetical protein
MGRASRRKRDRPGVVWANQHGKMLHMHPVVEQAIRDQLAAFREKFGPGAGAERSRVLRP